MTAENHTPNGEAAAPDNVVKLAEEVLQNGKDIGALREMYKRAVQIVLQGMMAKVTALENAAKQPETPIQPFHNMVRLALAYREVMGDLQMDIADKPKEPSGIVGPNGRPAA